MHKKVAIIIPARYLSSRFPAKPIALIGTKPMLYYVYQASKLSKYNPKVIIATDNDEIYNTSLTFVQNKDEVQMTPTNLSSGTQRVAFIAKSINEDFVINLQGDEPLVTPMLIDSMIEELNYLDNITPVLSLAKKRNLPAYSSMFKDPNVVKLLINAKNLAIYFSRAPIPGSKSNVKYFYQHVGIYAYKKSFLFDYINMEESYYEKTESLEQLRVIENGFSIRIKEIEDDLHGVDVPADIEIVKTILEQKGTLL